MKRMLPMLTLLAVLLLSLHVPCAAQNVSGYGTMPDPFLFLLREPVVHDDLALRPEQKERLIALNESFDGVLLATRNMSPEEGQKRVTEVLTKSRKQVAKFLSVKQQERLRQIAFRLRGLSFVLVPHAAEQLKLAERQKDQIQSVVKKAIDRLSELQSSTYQGKEAHQKSQLAVANARKEEYQEILKILDNEQKQKLITLVGRRFDSAGLGKVSFRAPELATGNEWINSKALQLNDLTGKVVALHFWTFG